MSHLNSTQLREPAQSVHFLFVAGVCAFSSSILLPGLWTCHCLVVIANARSLWESSPTCSLWESSPTCPLSPPTVHLTVRAVPCTVQSPAFARQCFVGHLRHMAARRHPPMLQCHDCMLTGSCVQEMIHALLVSSKLCQFLAEVLMCLQ